LDGADVECRVEKLGGAKVGSLSMHVAHCGGFGVGLILLNLFSCELGPGVEETGVDGDDPSGDDWREESCVVENDSVSKMGQDGCIHGVWCEHVDGMGGRWWKQEAYVVQGLGQRVASTGHYWWLSCLNLDVGVVVNFDCVVGENGGAIVVTDFANG
jgi:hypothetical protein